MTAQQQLYALGISADAYEGNVIIEMPANVGTFTIEEIKRFQIWLDGAEHDAIRQTLARKAA